MPRAGRVALAVLATLAALVSTGAAARRVEPAQTQIDVYIAGHDGYHTYRIPSLIVTPKGRLLAFAEARRAAAADSGDIDLVLKRSHDNGTTWSPMQVIADDDANTVGNPCPVVDRNTGTILLLTTHNAGTDREQDIIAGTSAGSRTVWLMKSTDDGQTWSKPTDITREVKKPDWTWYATGPGIGIQTRSGRLVIPANHVEAGGVHRSHLFYSDDDGKTWMLGASADPGTNESQVVELNDGRLLLNMRNYPPKPVNFRRIATSQDEGRTLSPTTEDRTLIEPPAQASLIRLHDQLLFANPASTKRERMTVRISHDQGASWHILRVIHEGPSAYSSLAALPNSPSGIGLLYERGDRSPYEKITFARFVGEEIQSERALLIERQGSQRHIIWPEDIRRWHKSRAAARSLSSLSRRP